VRPYLGGRRGVILLAVAALGAGAALNWGWLVAIGVAPILLSLAPCAAMCALGLCMSKMGGKSCSPSHQGGRNDSSPAASGEPRDEVRPEAIRLRQADRQPD
jgi:hypothetical protein